MLPTIEGVIARRILLNYWADAEVVAKLVPKPLKVATHRGLAVVGICLIRLERLRPRGLPEILGMSSENMAHRIAIEFPDGEGTHPGVYILRRETDCSLVQLFGGRLFPGVQGKARFDVHETEQSLSIDVYSADGRADIGVKTEPISQFTPTRLFQSAEEMSEFFRNGDCGFSCSLHGGKLEGMRLKTLEWKVSMRNIVSARSAVFDDPEIFPKGSIGLDCALLMRNVPHEWHELKNVPELAAYD